MFEGDYGFDSQSSRIVQVQVVPRRPFCRAVGMSLRQQTTTSNTCHFTIPMHRLAHLLPIFLLFSVAHGLHFYLDANEKRCFIEEVPTETVVHGIRLPTALDCNPTDTWSM